MQAEQAEVAGRALDEMREAQDYTLLSWKIDPENLSPAAQEIWTAECQAPVVVSEDVSLRPKILDACGMTCTFCHNEGTPVVAQERVNQSGTARDLGRVSIYSATNGVDFLPGTMNPDDQFYDALVALRDALGVQEVHMTGGEPTLHFKLPELIKLAQAAGMSVKMTSNGENPRMLQKCADSGLEEVIFSIFGTNTDELSMVQHPKYRSPKLAERKIQSLRRSIEVCNELGIEASANVVVPGPGNEARVTSILRQFGNLSVRLLNSLDDGDASYAAIYEILGGLEAEPTGTRLTAGSSNTKINYRLPNGGKIAFKQIRPTRFGEVCDGCEVDEQDACEESFYGLRLYVDQDNRYRVGMCIQRMDLAMSLDEFVDSGLPQRLKEYRASEKIAMERYFQTTSNASQETA